MSEYDPYLWMCAGAAVGGVITWVVMRSRRQDVYRQGLDAGAAERATVVERLAGAERNLQEARAALVAADKAADALRAENSALGAKMAGITAQLDAERTAAAEKLALLEQARARLTDAFQALSAEALRQNNQSFLDLAKAALEKFQETAKGDLDTRRQSIDALVKPIRESLEKVGVSIQELEKSRVGAYAGLNEQLKTLAASQSRLQGETANLVRALRAPAVRGRWGEIQLKRVVEMAGMLEYCDFTQQESTTTEDGRLRPDLVVRLPGGKNLVVDAKAPLAAYLDALEAPDDETRTARLKDHARQIRAHLVKLGAKSYWEQFTPTPEFVVLFLPGETFFSAALEADPSLIESGVEARVILATPTTLIALLRAVAYGWRQERLADNAQHISDLGKQLYERLGTLADAFADVRKGLEKAVDSYNKAVGTLEARVLPAARRFKDLDATTGDDIPTLEPIDKAVRSIRVDPPALPPPE
jgi:DNA recombination protein RmuC